MDLYCGTGTNRNTCLFSYFRSSPQGTGLDRDGRISSLVGPGKVSFCSSCPRLPHLLLLETARTGAKGRGPTRLASEPCLAYSLKTKRRSLIKRGCPTGFTHSPVV